MTLEEHLQNYLIIMGWIVLICIMLCPLFHQFVFSRKKSKKKAQHSNRIVDFTDRILMVKAYYIKNSHLRSLTQN